MYAFSVWSVCAGMCCVYMSYVHVGLGLPGGSGVKNLTCNAGDGGSIPGEDPLEEGMAIHSNILAWRIPWTEEAGRLLSMGL